MRTQASQNVYSVIMSELEWNGTDEAARVIMQQVAMQEANDKGCQYISFLVEPDELFSEMETRKQVWRYSFPSALERQLYEDMLVLCAKYIRPGKLSIERFRNIALKAIS